MHFLSPLFLLAPLTASCAALSPQQSNAPTLTPHRVAELRSVSTALISPDGATIAYTTLLPRKPGIDDDGGPWSELMLRPTAGGEARAFIAGKGEFGQLAWTPDGKGLAFVAKRGDDKQPALYVLPVDGGEARRAVSLKTGIRSYHLAPDGKRVALLAEQPEEDARRKEREKGFSQEIYEEDVRPVTLWTAELFVDGSAKVVDIKGSLHQVQWSPQSDRLALRVAPTALVDDEYVRQRIEIVDPAGKALARIEREGKLGEIEWSPDGKWIGMISAVDKHDPSAGRLCVAAASGGPFTELAPGMAGDCAAFEWDSASTILAVLARGVETELARFDATQPGAQPQRLAGDQGKIIQSLSLSADGRQAALVVNSPNHPPELYTHSKGTLQRVTDSNPWLNSYAFAKQEVVRHKARDGQELEGILIRPLNEVAGTRYPLILSVHGGPEAHESNGWLTNYSRPGQMAAARGFAVFYPNYRGSTGRGVAFSKLGQGDAAGKEFDDLVDAVDHLIAIGLVDKSKVGITGGSYGGYATAWCSTRYSERFAAGVMFVGISDKISKVGTTDIPDEEYYVHALKRPWENWQFFLERSPIYYADKCKTPLLILHGKDDPRVNVGQSRELYRHLKVRNQSPVRLVLYPGEGHGNRRAASRLDYNLRMLQWFEHYLQGAGGEMPAYDLDYAEPKAAG
ncbi:MAG: hypothetical protein RL277_2911 [Planctomycetota bacterium]|jgi:dipeptidyl aminopeptidase/acylaminoacyl peptidase